MAAVVTSDGVTLHVTDEGHGEPVLLIAGYTAPATTWVFQAAAIAKTADGRTVIMEDCGHGANIDRPEEFNAHMIDFLEAL